MAPISAPVLNLIPENLDGLRILDCGFGYGEWGLMLRTRKEGLPHIVGVDIFKTYCDKNRELKIYDEIHCVDALEINQVINKPFDIIIASELLEHLEKRDSFRLLSELESLCSNLLIITTPRGRTFNSREVDGNKHNRHLSGWEVEEFSSLGFLVKVVDKPPLPRMLKIADKIRRRLFNLGRAPQQIIAWKHM